MRDGTIRLPALLAAIVKHNPPHDPTAPHRALRRNYYLDNGLSPSYNMTTWSYDQVVT
jgi:hypothetical protein